MHLILIRDRNEGSYESVACVYSLSDHSTTITVLLDQGSYRILCIGRWTDRARSFHLSVSGPHSPDLCKVDIFGNGGRYSSANFMTTMLNISDDAPSQVMTQASGTPLRVKYLIESGLALVIATKIDEAWHMPGYERMKQKALNPRREIVQLFGRC